MSLPRNLSERELAKFTEPSAGEVAVKTLGLGGTNYLGLASVNIGGVATGEGKTLNIASIALSATNLSGATIFVAAASKKFYVTNLFLSTASVVNLTFMSGATYLSGNASIRASFTAQSNLIENGSPNSPVYLAMANQQSFSIVTDTAAPVAGRVIWFEEA